jgi:hypothetical protein
VAIRPSVHASRVAIDIPTLSAPLSNNKCLARCEQQQQGDRRLGVVFVLPLSDRSNRNKEALHSIGNRPPSSIPLLRTMNFSERRAEQIQLGKDNGLKSFSHRAYYAAVGEFSAFFPG